MNKFGADTCTTASQGGPGRKTVSSGHQCNYTWKLNYVWPLCPGRIGKNWESTHSCGAGGGSARLTISYCVHSRCHAAISAAPSRDTERILSTGLRDGRCCRNGEYSVGRKRPFRSPVVLKRLKRSRKYPDIPSRGNWERWGFGCP